MRSARILTFYVYKCLTLATLQLTEAEGWINSVYTAGQYTQKAHSEAVAVEPEQFLQLQIQFIFPVACESWKLAPGRVQL